MNVAERMFAGAPNDPALRVDTGAVVTHQELRDRAARLARRIGDDAAPADRVALIAGNDPAFVEALLGILIAGAIVVPLEPSAPAVELRRQLDEVDPALVLCSPSTAPAAHAAADGRRPVLSLDTVAHDEVATLDPLAPVERSRDDIAALLFTSGTAGAPKAAMLSHGNFAAGIDQADAVPELALAADDVTLGVIPLFHVFGLAVVLIRTLAAGATVELVEHFDPAATLRRIRERHVTVLPAVPAMYSAWLGLTDAPSDSFAGVRVAASGATRLPRSVFDGMRQRFGVQVHEGYGLTEASPVVTSAVVDGDARPGSVGWPLPGVEVRLVDRSGADALEGDPGEILVRGANVFLGYWRDPETTARVLEGGWLHTGDVGVALDDGSLSLVDRAKDLIIVSGFNVYPAEVESELLRIPEIAAAAVVGAPDDRSGERVEAYVITTPEATIDPAAVVDALSGRLARYKVPSALHVVDELPRRFGGKIARHRLRERS